MSCENCRYFGVMEFYNGSYQCPNCKQQPYNECCGGQNSEPITIIREQVEWVPYNGKSE